MIRRVLAFLVVFGFIFGQTESKSSSSYQADEDRAWLDFKKLYKKTSFRRSSDEKASKNAFISNYRRVNKQNQLFEEKKSTWKARTYEDSDLTPDQFRAFKTGIKKPLWSRRSGTVAVEKISAKDAKSLPDSWDIRTQGPGLVSEVKYQGSCGSCWAFATVAALENYRSIRTKTLNTFSEQYLLDCDREGECEGCAGGWFDCAFDFVKNRGGLPLEESYPYNFMEHICNTNVTLFKGNFPSQLVFMPRDIPTIQNWLKTNGTCVVCVDSKNLNIFEGGIFNEGGPECNHAVVLVGYGPGYWILRNSWGDWWGEKGYYRANSSTGGVFYDVVGCYI